MRLQVDKVSVMMMFSTDIEESENMTGEAGENTIVGERER